MNFSHENSGVNLSMDDEELFFIGALVIGGLVYLSKKNAPATVAGLPVRSAPVVDAEYVEVESDD